MSAPSWPELPWLHRALMLLLPRRLWPATVEQSFRAWNGFARLLLLLLLSGCGPGKPVDGGDDQVELDGDELDGDELDGDDQVELDGDGDQVDGDGDQVELDLAGDCVSTHNCEPDPDVCGQPGTPPCCVCGQPGTPPCCEDP